MACIGSHSRAVWVWCLHLLQLLFHCARDRKAVVGIRASLGERLPPVNASKKVRGVLYGSLGWLLERESRFKLKIWILRVATLFHVKWILGLNSA